MDIAVVIVVYNPVVEYFMRNVQVCLSQAKKIFLIDNSENPNEYIRQVYQKNSNVIYVSLGENRGIAYALNIGCEKAISQKYEWLLTLDQDSMIPVNYINSITNYIQQNLEKNIGIVGPLCKMDDNDNILPDNRIDEVYSIITSGAVMNLFAYEKIGGFKENLFIDAVDTEYCWNLRAHGYKIIQLCNLLLEHHIGNSPYHIKVFGRRILTVTNHNHLRCYYIVRNSLKISHDYRKVFPEIAGYYKMNGIKLFIKVLLFERNKMKKMQSIIRGYLDYKKKIYGKYRW